MTFLTLCLTSSQAALKQALADLKKEAAENTERIDHWQREHDKLRLEDIE